MTNLLLPVRLSGAVWGHLVGDAMGVPYEFREPAAIGEVRWGERGAHGKPAGTWSDDGALMLSLLDSLLEVEFDPEDQGRRALDWRRNGAYTPEGDVFDIGIATAAALDRLAAGTPAEQAGASGDRSASNGSLMRILPLALWGHRKSSRDELVDLALRASSVTHRHPACRVACAIYVLVVDRLLAGMRPEEALASALRDAADGLTRAEDELPAALEELRAWPKTHEPQGRGGVLDAFWSAWTAFAGATDYHQTIERAIAYGRDTDTTAAIAGGLAGTRWGIDSIPREWLTGMRGRAIGVPLVDRLIAAHGWRTSTTNALRVDWVDLDGVPKLAGVPGRLGMTYLPGKQYVGWHAPWWRDLDADVELLGTAHGCDLFLLLVEDHELVDTRTERLPDAFETHGIELLRHPVVDMDVPSDREAYAARLGQVAGAVRAGKSVVVACRGGLGRTGTAVACILVEAGLSPDVAIALTRQTRRETIERGTQVEFVHSWAARPPRPATREEPAHGE